MAQTHEGARKVAANKAGLSVAEYQARLDAGEKWCYKCAAWRDRADFRIDRSRFDGLSATCASCRTKGTWKGPPRLERLAKRAAGYGWCRLCADWHPLGEMHQGLCRSHWNSERRRLYASNEHFRRTQQQRVHARKRAVDPIPASAQAMILGEFGGLCAYCRVAPATTWDHIVAVSQGGRTTPGNVVPACAPCNSSKGTRDVFEWMSERGFVPCDAFENSVILGYAGVYG